MTWRAHKLTVHLLLWLALILLYSTSRQLQYFMSSLGLLFFCTAVSSPFSREKGTGSNSSPPGTSQPCSPWLLAVIDSSFMKCSLTSILSHTSYVRAVAAVGDQIYAYKYKLLPVFNKRNLETIFALGLIELNTDKSSASCI